MNRGIKALSLFLYEHCSLRKLQLEEWIQNKIYYCYYLKNLYHRDIPELRPENYGLLNETIHNLVDVLHTGLKQATTSELEKHLHDVYCGPLAVEFQHIRVIVLIS